MASVSATHSGSRARLTAPADLNVLNAKLWPDNTCRSASGMLTLNGLAVDDIAQQTSTPAYIYDKATVDGAAHAILEAFVEALTPLGVDVHPYYASKAFSASTLLRWVADAGYGIDVASEGELAMALAAGVTSATIGVHGNNKSARLIERAVAVGVGSIVIDCASEVVRIAEVAAASGHVQPVRVRVTTGVHAETHDFLATAVEDQKFGIALADVPDIVAEIREQPSLKFLGMHSHIGSQIFNAEGFATAIERLMTVQATLLKDGPVPELNLGGGYGIAYTDADHPLPIRSIVHEVVAALQSSADCHNVPIPTIAIEPGRLIAGRAGVTVYRVGTIKDVKLHEPTELDEAGQPATRRYVAVDGGMSDNPRPELYDADYTAVVARATHGAPVLSRVVGMHCESGDIVVHDVYLPDDIATGDLLVVPVTGAYCQSLSSNYNLVPRPAVWGNVEGHLELMIRGETIDDLLARDVAVDDGTRPDAAAEGAQR